jgi:tetratricopeptide (TPR) repeat protein
MKTLTVLALLMASLPLFAQANALGSTDQLQQLTAQLQQSPGDQALREKIIALALTINPKPATPDAATMAEGAAEYAFKNAKVNSDFSDAAKQYEKALLLAPWLAADYFNCGVAFEKAGENKEAVRSFNLYLLAAPNADDALAVKKRIGGLQYAAQKAVDEANSPEAQFAKFLKIIDGGVWRCDSSTLTQSNSKNPYPDTMSGRTFLAVSGHSIRFINNDIFNARSGQGIVAYDPNSKPMWTTTLTSHKFSGPSSPIPNLSSFSYEFTISDDGQSITEVGSFVFPWYTQYSNEHFVRIK